MIRALRGGTDRAATRAGNPVSASLRMVSSPVWAAMLLAFAATLGLFGVGYEVAVTGALRAGNLVMLVAALLAVAAAVVIWLHRSARSTLHRAVAVVILDTVAIAYQLAPGNPGDTRTAAVLVIAAGLVGAAGLPRRFCFAHLIGAAVLLAVMVGVLPAGEPGLNRVFETGVTIGVLVASTTLIGIVVRTITARIGELRTLALTDKLTGALNRRGLTEAFGRMLAHARREQHIGIVMVDIDHFKWFNDQYGHATGDVVLQRVGRALRDAAGPGGLVCRLGGEELAAIVIGDPRPVAESFRTSLAGADRPRVTASLGIVRVRAGQLAAPDDLARLLACADRALYEAKETGRDRICEHRYDREVPIATRETPTPQVAAVAAESTDTLTPQAYLPGWALLTMAALALAWSAGGSTHVHSGPLGPVITALTFAGVIVGAILVGTTPLFERFRWFSGILGTDLIALLMIVQHADAAARINTLLPFLLTGLMLAQRFSRFGLVLHHLLVVFAALVALAPVISVATLSATAVHVVIIIGAAEFVSWLRDRNEQAASDLHRWSVTDPLTGLVNRHGLEIAFARLSTAEQHTVLAVDVNDFKSINDTHGHAAGDDALIRLASTLRTVAGIGAVVGRTGGDEFVVVAPSVAPLPLSKTIRNAVALLPIPLSVSIGSAVAAQYRMRSLWALVATADAALVTAKRAHHATETAQIDTVGHDLGTRRHPNDTHTTHSAARPSGRRSPAETRPGTAATSASSGTGPAPSADRSSSGAPEMVAVRPGYPSDGGHVTVCEP